ncbi:MAG: hypothetical protein WCA84_09075 [Ignavibacteriaceae bacterium]
MIIIVTLFLIIILLVCQYVFNIYETEIDIIPNKLFVNGLCITNISIIPVNALGFKIPFRKISGTFDIVEGKELVDILREDDGKGRISLRTKKNSGKVVIYVKSKKSFLPSLVEIIIYPNTL